MNAKKKLMFAHNPLLAGPSFGERVSVGSPYREIELSTIKPDPNQPRIHFDEQKLNELADSIKAYGVLSPIIVRPAEEIGKYTIVAGERRYRASTLAGLKSIPAMIEKGGQNSAERTLAVQLVENIQRADLSPLERANAIGALRDTYELSVRDIADKLGISKSMVQRSLEILTLPDDLMAALREGAAESKILLLAKIEDPDIRASYLQDLEMLTRTQLQKNVDDVTRSNGKDKGKGLTPDDLRVTDEIQRSLGLKVFMNKPFPESPRGKLSIEFYNETDLREIYRKLVAE